jgi:hypothetical protein
VTRLHAHVHFGIERCRSHKLEESLSPDGIRSHTYEVVLVSMIAWGSILVSLVVIRDLIWVGGGLQLL